MRALGILAPGSIPPLARPCRSRVQDRFSHTRHAVAPNTMENSTTLCRPSLPPGASASQQAGIQPAPGSIEVGELALPAAILQKPGRTNFIGIAHGHHFGQGLALGRRGAGRLVQLHALHGDALVVQVLHHQTGMAVGHGLQRPWAAGRSAGNGELGCRFMVRRRRCTARTGPPCCGSGSRHCPWSPRPGGLSRFHRRSGRSQGREGLARSIKDGQLRGGQRVVVAPPGRHIGCRSQRGNEVVQVGNCRNDTGWFNRFAARTLLCRVALGYRQLSGIPMLQSPSEQRADLPPCASGNGPTDMVAVQSPRPAEGFKQVSSRDKHRGLQRAARPQGVQGAGALRWLGAGSGGFPSCHICSMTGCQWL
ncbi:hypothetical protein FQR65_LT20079 [Abscondita terminalis]|nr:hypothetical protein FQR65_LT20079 [Abscondita terminalis]